MSEDVDTTAAGIEPVIRRLGRTAALSPAQAERLGDICRRTETFRPGVVIVQEGKAGVRPRFILSGWACRQRILADGRRQIFNLTLPGDTIGCSHHSRTRPATTSTVALTRVVTIDAAPALETAEGLGEVFELSEFNDQTLLLDHIMRLGRQTAYERMIHLLLEIGERLALAGAGGPYTFPLPLTQEALADVLGLSIVHVNRTLQQLRRDRLLEFNGGWATLLDPELLASIADYTPHNRRDGQSA